MEKTFEILDVNVAGNSIVAYLSFLAFTLGGWVLGYIVNAIIKNKLEKLAAKTDTKLDDLVVGIIGGPVVLVLLVVGMSIGSKSLSGGAAARIEQLYACLVYFAEAWILLRAIDGLYTHYLAPWLAKTDTKIDDVVVPIVLRAVKVAVVLFVALLALERFGFGVAPVINLITYFGLMLVFAAALSAIWLLRSFIGGIVVLLDRPFAEGDTIGCGDVVGRVEKIEMYRTILRTKEGIRVVVPNHELVTSQVRLLHDVASAPAAAANARPPIAREEGAPLGNA